jgi:hypothetical protein
MWNEWKRGEMHTELCRGSRRERDHLENVSLGLRKILKMYVQDIEY